VFILILGIIDTIITYCFEAFFIRSFTVRYDAKTENAKSAKFAQEMEDLIPELK
jgi:hypothetical protein